MSTGIQIHDLLPAYRRFLDAATAAGIAPQGSRGRPDARARELARILEAEYVEPHAALLRPLFSDWDHWTRPLIETLTSLDLEAAQQAVTTAGRRGYPARAERTLRSVEKHFGRSLEGNLVLMAGFGRADGYARFDQGNHCVYIGLDYPEPEDHYLDLIIAHELGHVLREGDPRTWQALGLPSVMPHEQFQQSCPFEEHMIGEGLSTAVSEAIFPGYAAHEYLFFTREEYAWCASHEQEIWAALRRFYGTAQEHYSLYARDSVAPGSPERTQYYAGFSVLQALRLGGSSIRELITLPSKQILERTGKL